LRQPAQRRPQREDDQSYDEDQSLSVPVRERASGQERGCKRQRVGVNDPLDIRKARMQGALDLWERHGHDGQVNKKHKCRRAGNDEGPPLFIHGYTVPSEINIRYRKDEIRIIALCVIIETMESVRIDLLDHRIIQSLQLDPRAPFSRLATILGPSEQTIARRYRRLVADHVVRVVAELNSQRISQRDWLVRLRCVPGSATVVATKVARDQDTSWVQVASGGTEIFVGVRSHHDTHGTPLLLEQLSLNRRVVDMRAYCLLHEFTNGVSSPLGSNYLSSSEIDRLTSHHRTARATDRTAAPLQESDWPLIRALGKDGRMTFRQLADETHWHESTVRRRVEELVLDGVLFFNVDLDNHVVGLNAPALLWMSVAPPKLAEVGEALAGLQQIPFAAATTGSTNLVATVLCSDEAALYQYLTQELASLKGILNVEVALVMQTVKLYSMTTQMRSRVGAERSRPQVPAMPESEALSVDTPS